jgi:four helix bundle protein
LTITSFEDIQTWQEGRELVKLVYEAIKGNRDFTRGMTLVSQIQGAAVSAMSNIAEGFRLGVCSQHHICQIPIQTSKE